ncbi:MAG: hypothetical protein KKB00_16540 [Gammaproteobacteria bacterium]|nr:hypothetical protein [Gammaproteobacteria bacterium]
MTKGFSTAPNLNNETKIKGNAADKKRKPYTEKTVQKTKTDKKVTAMAFE